MRKFESQPYENELYCNDPAHGNDCECGADPDYEYESKLDI